MWYSINSNSLVGFQSLLEKYSYYFDNYKIDINKPQGSRITDMTLLKTGEKIDPSKTYIVSGWASVNENTEGPQIWDVVENYIRRNQTISIEPSSNVKVVGI